MTKETLDTMKQALEKAKEELDRACYLEESGGNAGIRKMNANKAEWLKWVVSLAETGLATEEAFADIEIEIREGTDEESKNKCEDCLVVSETNKIIRQKDKLIKELSTKNEDLTERLDSLQLTYDCELEYRKALAARAKIDHFTEVLRIAHARSWYDEGVLVTPVEYLDRSLLELIKE